MTDERALDPTDVEPDEQEQVEEPAEETPPAGSVDEPAQRN